MGSERVKQQRTTTGTAAVAPAAPAAPISGGGKSLPAQTQAAMSSRFGHDFSRVRVHTDARAEEAAGAYNAQAFTVGPNIVFGAGQYDPHTTRGQHLLAHELTHVVQQERFGAPTALAPQARLASVSQAGDASEQEAEQVAAQVVSGRPVQVRQAPGAGIARRQLDEDAPSPRYDPPTATGPHHPLPAPAQSGLAGGLFPQLRYPILHDLPPLEKKGPSTRYDVSFRDVSSWSRVPGNKSESPVFLNRLDPAPPPDPVYGGTRFKGLRLGFGENAKTLDPAGAPLTNWHWNQSGAANTFGIADHALASPGAATFGRIMNVAKPLGRGAMVLGAGLDAYSLGSEINQSRQTGNWNNTVVEGSRIAGGWGGAWAGAEAGGTLGATLGMLGGPLGAAAGAAVGGLVGGALGYFGGSALGKWLGKKAAGDEPR